MVRQCHYIPPKLLAPSSTFYIFPSCVWIQLEALCSMLCSWHFCLTSSLFEYTPLEFEKDDEYEIAFLAPYCLQCLIPWDSSKWIFEEAKVCCPAIQFLDLGFCLPSSLDTGLCHLWVTAVKVTFDIISTISPSLLMSMKFSRGPPLLIGSSILGWEFVTDTPQEHHGLLYHHSNWCHGGSSPFWELGPVNLRVLLTVHRRPHQFVHLRSLKQDLRGSHFSTIALLLLSWCFLVHKSYTNSDTFIFFFPNHSICQFSN